MVVMYPSQAACLCFHLLYTSFLCSSLARISLVIHAGLLSFLIHFLLCGMECSWAWRWCSLDINHVSWVPLPYRAFFYGILPSKSLKLLKSALLKSNAMILPLPCSLTLGCWAPHSNGHCSHGCLQPSHPQLALLCLWVQGPAEHLSSLASLSPGSLLSPGSGSCNWCSTESHNQLCPVVLPLQHVL